MNQNKRLCPRCDATFDIRTGHICPFESKTEAACNRVRREANNWTPEYRAELLKKGMAIVNGTVRVEWLDAACLQRLHAAIPDLVDALKDAYQSLKRLPDVDGAHRVTCMRQIELACQKAGIELCHQLH